jgi:acyl-CoA synthetase (AMP-forming)/AMP-acid ligase II
VWGSRQVLVVMRRNEIKVARHEVGHATITGFCGGRLTSYKVPIRRAICSASEFRRTPIGKIYKPSLRQELATNTVM